MPMSQLVRLYTSILRLHRWLPSIDLRIIGDEYVKKEFREHHKKATPEQLSQFLREWSDYHDTLKGQLKGQAPIGRDLDHSVNLSDEQKLDVMRLKETFNTPLP